MKKYNNNKLYNIILNKYIMKNMNQNNIKLNK